MKRLLLPALVVLLLYECRAQGELQVDMHVGKPQVAVPLVTVSSNELSDVVSLWYDAGGVKVQQPTGNFGIGWNLQAGGMVSRVVRGLPDDWTGSSSDARRGWFYKNSSSVTNAYDINHNFPNSSDTLLSTYLEEYSDYVAFNTYNYWIDTEPDVFYYHFGNYSGRFVFDNSDPPVVHTVPYTDLKIAVTQGVGSDKSIQSIAITTDDGVVYTFNQKVRERHITKKIAASVDFRMRDFQLYDYSRYSDSVSHSIGWVLTKVQSPQGAVLTYTYEKSSIPTTDTIRVAIQNNSGGTYTSKDLYIDYRLDDQLQLYSIVASSSQTSTGSAAYFLYDNSMLSSVTLKDTRRSSSYVKEYDLTYQSVIYNNYERFYLQTITETSGCNQLPPYRFSYLAGSGYPVNLPSYYSRAIDFWGYYNGSYNTRLTPSLFFYPGLQHSEQVRLYPIPSYSGENYTATDADRTPDGVAMMAGVLNSIQYPMGGTTTIVYEPHQYYDTYTHQTFIGGGLRVAAVTYFDGVNSSNVIQKTYRYTDSTGVSTGRLISTPMFAIPTFQYRDPSTGTVVSKANDWSFLTVRTEDDLSAQETIAGSPVAYQEVRVSRNGSGYARYQYLMPALFGSKASGNWAPSINKFARGASIGMGPVTSGGTWMFPYAPNPNFDHERGLVWQMREYAPDSTKLVRKTLTTYQYLYKPGTSSPYSIYGIDYDYFPYCTTATYFYSKYNWLADVTKVVQSETVTIYDASTMSKHNTSSTTYTHGSTTTHNMVTQVTQTAADGTAYSTYLKYPLDYGTVPSGSDTTSQMIASLQTNFRNGSPIEQYSTLQKSGGVENVTGGSIMRYNNFGTSNVLPKRQYTYQVSSPVAKTSFTPSYIDGTSKTFKFDHNYLTAKTYLSFDAYGNPQSSVGANRITSAAGWSFGNTLPVVTARNADVTQFSFSDFESHTPATGLEFTVTGNIYYGNGHTGTNAIYPGASFSKTVTKAAVNNYVLSFWISCTASINFTPTLKNASGTTISNPTITIPSTGGAFTYFSVSVPVSGVTSSTMSMTLTSNQTGTLSGYTIGALSPGLQPMIDELSFYPAGADLTSYTYTIPFGVSAAVSGNQALYTVFDNLGRKKYVMDAYNNIREKDTYSFPSQTAPTLVSQFTTSTPGDLSPMTFTASGNDCIDGTATYQWKTSPNGYPANPASDTSYFTGSMVQQFIFSHGANRKVTLKVTHPAFTNPVISTSTFTVPLTNCTVNMCAAGAWTVTVCSSPVDVSTTSSYTCSGLTAPGNPSGTTFEVTGISVAETITNYQWYTMPTGGSTWALVSSGSTATTYSVVKILPSATTGYDVMCTVTTSTGRTGSTIMHVVVTVAC